MNVTSRMSGSDIIGFAIMENDNTFKEVNNLSIHHDNGLNYAVFDTVLQSLDCENRNHRSYGKDGMIRSLSHPNITELIRNKKWKGEAGHPIDGTVKRIATVDPKCTSHYITKWWNDKDLIRGTIETIDDGLYGTKLYRSILQGENPSFSFRGFAEMVKKGKTQCVINTPTAVTYDEVNLPSHREAYADNRKEFVSQTMDGKKTSYVREGMDASKIIRMEDVIEMAQRKSDNLKVVCECFDIDPASIYTADANTVTMKKGNTTYICNLESLLSREIAGFMGRL